MNNAFRPECGLLGQETRLLPARPPGQGFANTRSRRAVQRSSGRPGEFTFS